MRVILANIKLSIDVDTVHLYITFEQMIFNENDTPKVT